MRIWLVPARELSDQHLLGQHREVHTLIGMFQTRKYDYHRMAYFFRNKGFFLVYYHSRLVKELDYRFNHYERNGGRHPTPVPFWLLSGKEWKPSKNWMDYDRMDLAQRYAAEPKKFTWTKREKPWWAKEKFEKVALGAIPAHAAGAKMLGVNP